MPLVDIDYEIAEDAPEQETPAPVAEQAAAAALPEERTQTTQGTETPDMEEPPKSSGTSVPPTPKLFQPTPSDIQRDQSSLAVKAREFQSRISIAQNQAAHQTDDGENFEPLLDHAVTLLESVAAHPALTDYGALKQRLDNIEQLLSTSANVR